MSLVRLFVVCALELDGLDEGVGQKRQLQKQQTNASCKNSSVSLRIVVTRGANTDMPKKESE